MSIDEGRDWHISYQKDEGFTLVAYETSFWGETLGQVFLWLTDRDEGVRIGRLKLPGFCWINPWPWTWHVGVDTLTVSWTTVNEDSPDLGNDEYDHQHRVKLETANLGSLWWRVGQRVLNNVDDWSRAREIAKIPLTVGQVKAHFPEAWERMGFLVE